MTTDRDHRVITGPVRRRGSATPNRPRPLLTAVHPPNSRTTVLPDLEAYLRIAGLTARRRDLPAITLAWTCSNGWIARKLGPLGPVLLPITGWGHLATAALYRHHTLHTHGAAAVVRRPHTRLRIHPAALPAIVLAVLGWATLLSAATHTSIWLAVTILVVVLIDTLGDRTQRHLRDRYDQRRQHRHPRPNAAGGPTSARPNVEHATQTSIDDAVEISCVAAFPRHTGHGTRLVRQLCSILDLTGTDAVLDARAPQVADWYLQHSFTTVTGRRMHRRAAPN